MKTTSVDKSEIHCKWEQRNWAIVRNLESQKLFFLWKLQGVCMLMERFSREGKGDDTEDRREVLESP